jgi:predicted AAA+ superfamily ATPase
MMIFREHYMKSVRRALRRSPVCAILGPRQCGKTTLARAVAEETKSFFFDLESPADQTRLANPELALASLRGLVVLDEVQAMPGIFPVLRVLADRKPLPARFLLLGSASPGIIRDTSETLAGRVEFVDMGGFDLSETGSDKWRELWMRGGFPKSYLARNQADSAAWREGFIRTFLERDLPNFGIRVPAPAMRRFWTMLAHSHGQVWNASEIARSMGLSDKTVRSYLDTLTETFVVRQLQPWFENIGKRQVKAPKIYLRDSGLLHALLGLGTSAQVESHPRVGASWEGFAVEQVLRRHRNQPAWFWGTQSGAELDLLVQDGNKRIGYEFKLSEKPTTTRSMRVAMEDLRLDELHIVCPGKISAPLDEGISITGIETLWA